MYSNQLLYYKNKKYRLLKLQSPTFNTNTQVLNPYDTLAFLLWLVNLYTPEQFSDGWVGHLNLGFLGFEKSCVRPIQPISQVGFLGEYNQKPGFKLPDPSQLSA